MLTLWKLKKMFEWYGYWITMLIRLSSYKLLNDKNRNYSRKEFLFLFNRDIIIIDMSIESACRQNNCEFKSMTVKM
jgi:hypothetical protein